MTNNNNTSLHYSTIEVILKELKTDPQTGLSSVEAEDRLKYGMNELETEKKKSIFMKFLEEFKDVLIIILIAAAVVSILVNPHDIADSIIIFIVVLLNAGLGVYQEIKAEKSLEALKKLSSPMAKVLRSKNTIQIPSKLLVVGDIVLVEAGDFVPADCRLIEVSNLKVDESSLTGESIAVEKTAEEIGKAKSLGDQTNALYSSTFVTYGRGKAVVTKTGMNTEIGKIARMLSKHKEELTPLQIKLNQIGKIIGILAIIICIAVFLIEWLSIYRETEGGILKSFNSAVALAVAAIPEGLSTVVVVVLALGVTKMVKRNAIVKKLPAVETLGSTSIVCSDKTGTLTQNRMTVVKVYKEKLKNLSDALNEAEQELLSYFALCTDSKISVIDGKEVRIGDPTETALIAANREKGYYRNTDMFIRVADLPFDSERKMMTVVVEYKGEYLSITKGAPDVILQHSIGVNKEEVLKVNAKMANDALRVLGVGIKYLESLPDQITSETLESNIQFIGLIGMIDPSRPEVKEAIKTAKDAGIRTIMITGDHVITAKAIAKELGILNRGEESITSDELSELSEEDLFENIERFSVYARVAPEDKVRIVDAWQKKGMVVAMTGDGVNDSPALKKADIGCAMGITGTDVAKEAASMILTDDNFATIIAAVEQGRGIYANIRKTVQYLLASNIGEVLTIFLATLFSAFALIHPLFGIPLLPMHLLWINLITDTLPAFALGMELPEENVMKRKPRLKNEGFFARGLGYKVLIQGILVGLLTLFSYSLGLTLSNDTKTGQTMAFLTLSMIQLFHAFNIKSNKSVFSKQVFNNRFLWLAFAIGMILQFGILYIPLFSNIFNVNPLSFLYVMISVGIAFLIIVIQEIVKILYRKIDRMNFDTKELQEA